MYSTEVRINTPGSDDETMLFYHKPYAALAWLFYFAPEDAYSLGNWFQRFYGDDLEAEWLFEHQNDYPDLNVDFEDYQPGWLASNLPVAAQDFRRYADRPAGCVTTVRQARERLAGRLKALRACPWLWRVFSYTRALERQINGVGDDDSLLILDWYELVEFVDEGDTMAFTLVETLKRIDVFCALAAANDPAAALDVLNAADVLYSAAYEDDGLSINEWLRTTSSGSITPLNAQQIDSLNESLSFALVGTPIDPVDSGMQGTIIPWYEAIYNETQVALTEWLS